MSDPMVTAAAQLLDDALTAMRETVSGAEPAALDWRPGPDTNSIAVLTVHSMHSTRSWLSVAMGAPLPERDRPAEFEATSESVGDLLGFYDSMATDCRALLDGHLAFDPVAERATHIPDDRRTGSWALMHALTHLREHVAHTQLTRQLWEMDRPGAERG
jgi:hypothetical protein